MTLPSSRGLKRKPSNASTASGTSKKGKAKKLKEPKAKKLPKMKNYKGTATKIVSLVAPLSAELEDLLRQKLSDQKVRGGVPAVYIQESEVCLQAALKISKAWEKVLTGGPAPTSDELQLANVQAFKKQAIDKLSTLRMMVKHAQAAAERTG